MTAANQTFGEVHFGNAELGNKARTKRLVKTADALVRHPGGTLPHKLKPAELQGLYRLLRREEVTHQSVLAAHQAETLHRIDAHAGPLLAISDATELDYSGLTSLEDLGPIGKGYHHRGYICQNTLIVDPRDRRAIGLAQQILHTRVAVAPDEPRSAHRERGSRESRLWPRSTEPLPSDTKLVVVCDRGGDTFEELEHELRSGRRFLVRSARDRQALAGHRGTTAEKLYALAHAAEPVGSYEVEVEASKGQPARTATVQYAFVAARLAPPLAARGEHSQEPLPVWVVRVWESNPPAKGALEWFLLTNVPIDSAAQAREVVSWYECRWVIEEYHKALKTGCGIEDLQFTHASRLEPVIALLSIVALTLLNLRDASRRADAQTAPATTVVDAEYVTVLSQWRHGAARPDWSVHDFFLALARLGGHQNRKHDKRPGWLVLWRGWTSLQLLLAGARLNAPANSKKSD